MTPLLRRPVSRLYRAWLARLQAEVAGYLAQNGRGPIDMAKVAAACPATGGQEQVAEWAVRRVER